MKKDNLFVLILGLVLGNLGWMCIKLASALYIAPRSFYLWGILAANFVVIWGVFYLFRDYKRRLRAAKKEHNAKLDK